MELAVILVWKLWTVYANMFVGTTLLSCIIKIRGLFKSSKWRHFQNVKFEALSAQRVCHQKNCNINSIVHGGTSALFQLMAKIRAQFYECKTWNLYAGNYIWKCFGNYMLVTS